jgi:hypothetical protein
MLLIACLNLITGTTCLRLEGSATHASCERRNERLKKAASNEDCRPAREAKAAVKLGFAAGGAHEGKRKTKSFFSFLFPFLFSSVFNTSFFVSHLSLRTELSDCMLLAAGKYTRKSKSGKEKQIE